MQKLLKNNPISELITIQTTTKGSQATTDTTVTSRQIRDNEDSFSTALSFLTLLLTTLTFFQMIR